MLRTSNPPATQQQHWQTEEDQEDDDIVIFFLPPVPSYAAPPPPVASNSKAPHVSPRKISESSSANLTSKPSSSQTAPIQNGHKLSPSKPPSSPNSANSSYSDLPSTLNSNNSKSMPKQPLPTPQSSTLQPPQTRPRSGSDPEGVPKTPPNAKLPPIPDTTHAPGASMPNVPAKKVGVPVRSHSEASSPRDLHKFSSTSTVTDHTAGSNHPILRPVPPKPTAPPPPVPLIKQIPSGSRVKESAAKFSAIGIPPGGSISPRDASPPASDHTSPRNYSLSFNGSIPSLPPGPAPSLPSHKLPPRAKSNDPRLYDIRSIGTPNIPPMLEIERIDKSTPASISPSESSNGITAPSRPGLRVDDSISDNRVIQEIVITHADYVQDLRIIRTMFSTPMKSLIPPDIHKVFFNGIDNVIAIDEKLMDEFASPKKLQPMDIAKIFACNFKGMQAYTNFCARQDQTLKLMTELLETNPEFSKYCEDVRKDPLCRGLSFDAFIIKPLQRLCKLPLLIRELMKTISGETEEKRKLESVMTQIEGLLDEINQMTGSFERMIELERHLVKKYPQVETLSLSRRILLLDGPIAWVVKQTKDSAKLRMGHFWLLDQLLLFCRSPKELDFIMPLNTVSISKNLPPVQNFLFVLELIDMTAQGIVTRKLCCATRELYDNLLAKLQ